MVDSPDPSEAPNSMTDPSGVSGERSTGTESLDALGAFDDGGRELFDGRVLSADIEDLAAVVHDDVAVADLVGVVQVVGHEDRADSLALELEQVVQEGFGCPHREGRCRLV